MLVVVWVLVVVRVSVVVQVLVVVQVSVVQFCPSVSRCPSVSHCPLLSRSALVVGSMLTQKLEGQVWDRIMQWYLTCAYPLCAGNVVMPYVRVQTHHTHTHLTHSITWGTRQPRWVGTGQNFSGYRICCVLSCISTDWLKESLCTVVLVASATRFCHCTTVGGWFSPWINYAWSTLSIYGNIYCHIW